jgi:hypothetical protein
MKRLRRSVEQDFTRVPFSLATRDHIVNVLKLNLEPLSRYDSSLVLPDNVIVTELSEFLQKNLRHHISDWDLSSEVSRKYLISDFIHEAIYNIRASLKIKPEFPLNYEERGVSFSGYMDLVISGEGLQSYLLVVEAKKEWALEDGLNQLLCEAGCLLRSREKLVKKTPILAVLSDAFHFQFFAIDERNGSVFVDLTNMSDFRHDQQAITVVRWLVWFLQIFVAVSPTSSPRDWSSSRQESRLQELRSCFS